MSNATKLTREEDSMYAWERCTHEGIGLPGCRVCDPDKHRVAARYEYVLALLRADRDRLREACEALVKWEERAEDRECRTAIGQMIRAALAESRRA